MILLSTIQYNTIRIVQHNTCTVPVIVYNLYIKWNSLEITGPVIFIRWNWQFCFNIQNCNRIMQISFSNKFLACQPIKRLKVLKNLTTMREWNVASSLLHVLIIQIYIFKNRKKQADANQESEANTIQYTVKTKQNIKRKAKNCRKTKYNLQNTISRIA